MAFVGQVILSSSPSRVATPLRGSITPVSSSPSLPSPSQLFATKTAAKIRDKNGSEDSNSIAWGDILLTTVRNSASALESSREGVSGIVTDFEEKAGTDNGKHKQAKSKKSQAGEDGSGRESDKVAAPKIATPKLKNKSVVTAESSRSHKQAGLSRKQSAEKKGKKKRNADLQSKIEGTRITKPGVIRATAGKKGNPASSSTKSPQDNTSGPTHPSKQKTNIAAKEPLELLLAEAVRRRKAWTPPKDTPLEVPHVEKLKGALNENLTLESQEFRKTSSGGFDNLLGDFGYADQEEGWCISSDQCRSTNGEALTKRRKLELVNLAPPQLAVQSRKTKLPKKKPQTVTGKATAPFLAVDSGTPSLLPYLEAEAPGGNQLTSIADPKTQVSTSAAVRRKSKPKALTQASSAKSRNKSQLSPVLHSPKTAMKSANEQELIFGTSSQLVREESPTCLKDIQQAIKVSQLMSEESSMFPTGNITPRISSKLPDRASVMQLTASKNLWSVASRGLDGSLLTVEVIDLLDSPRPVMKQPLAAIPGPHMIINMADGKDCAAEADSSLALPSSVDLLQNPKRPLQSEQTDKTLERSIPRSLAEASLRNRRQSRSPVKKQKIPKDSGVPLTDPMPKEMPNYQGFTTVDLCKEIASFGFKAIKKRSEMIALLERCWESQARIALQTLQPNVKTVKPVASRANEDGVMQSKPSKRKGKLPDSATAEATSTVVPSPPKRRGRPRKQAPSPSHPSPPEPLPVSGPAPPTPGPTSSSQTNLHAQITNAINAAPATHSTTNPTFRERILLYDPIVLEDLTAWLNTEGLGRVGTDEEVGIGVVKGWCERESVCCLSRDEGWRARR